MNETRFHDFLVAWDHRDLEAMLQFLDDTCVYESAVGPEPGGTAVGRAAVRQAFAAEFATDSRELLVDAQFVCGARGMREWTASAPLVDGQPQLQRGCDWFEFTGDMIHRISVFRKVGQGNTAPLDKGALLTHIRASYDRFQARLAPLSDAQMTAPGAVGTWSIKDVLAHLTAWHEHGVRWYGAVARGEEPPPEPEGVVDDVNASLIAPYQAQSLAEVREAFQMAAQQVMVVVASLSDADLFEAGRFPWMDGHAMWEGVAYNTFAHYDEHGPMIQQWLDANS